MIEGYVSLLLNHRSHHCRNTDSTMQTLQQIENELHVELLPGTELMTGRFTKLFWDYMVLLT